MDAYSRIFSTMQEAGQNTGTGQLHLRFARVQGVDPLRVEVAGTDQEASQFYLSAHLVPGQAMTLTVSGGQGQFVSNASSISINSGTLRLSETTAVRTKTALMPGDLVLLLTEDDQTFYLIDKVVQAT